MDFLYNECKKELSNLTGINFITLTPRCNAAIKLALRVAQNLEKKHCYILDQGGWMTYEPFAKKQGFTMHTIKTKTSVLNLKELHFEKDSILIMHSLSAYCNPQPMKEIYEVCKQQDCLLINDCSGSITDPDLLYGDIFVGSFGKWKPINNGKGGFIGTKDKHLDKEIMFEEFDVSSEQLLEKITHAKNRVAKNNEKSLAIMDVLQEKFPNIKIYNPNILKNQNLVVLCSYSEEIAEFCTEQEWPIEICPRDIRITIPAISIETKRFD
ncbi:MAG: DegT/DnrJ/EryC1/StrS family aminotransferase [Candidatus Woesearchaeota archaeon]